MNSRRKRETFLFGKDPPPKKKHSSSNGEVHSSSSGNMHSSFSGIDNDLYSINTINDLYSSSNGNDIYSSSSGNMHSSSSGNFHSSSSGNTHSSSNGHSFPSMMREMGDCDEEEVQKAIREYQRTYNLPETGRLDEETKNLMSTTRCGNKDEDKSEEVPHQGLNAVLDKVSGSLQSDNSRVKRDTDTSGRNGRSESAKSLSGGRLWKRSTSRAGANSKLMQVLAGDGTAPRSYEAQMKYTEEYIKRIRREAKGKKFLLHDYTSRERKKRSVKVWNENGLPLGKYMDSSGEVFNVGVIKWRLLDTGYSNRIPLEDQRSTISLAFRMWSEVIPLSFIEDTESDINTVPIQIAFGSSKF